MTKTLKLSRVRVATLALIIVGAATGWGQGTIIYHVPQQPIYYNPVVAISTGVDLDGNGTVDYTLISNIAAPGESDLRPHGSNTFIVVPEPPPDYGSLVAALSQGDLINSSPSSLDPRYVWYDRSADPFGYSLIALQVSIGTAGYFFGGIHYVGLNFDIGGRYHFGWLRIDSPSPDVAYGQVLDWAYELRPDTPIFAGAGVPEPGTWALLLVGCALLAWRRRSLP